MDPNPSQQPIPENQQGPQSLEVPKAPEVIAAVPSESAPPAVQGSPAPPPVLPPTLEPVTATVADSTADEADVQGPAIADDVDVIEKEWVEKAQEVIEHTKDDPYQEEEQIEDLQADYLKKRYGKDIKNND